MILGAWSLVKKRREDVAAWWGAEQEGRARHVWGGEHAQRARRCAGWRVEQLPAAGGVRVADLAKCKWGRAPWAQVRGASRE